MRGGGVVTKGGALAAGESGTARAAFPHHSCDKLPSRCRRYRSPRHSMRLPKNAPAQTTTWARSFNGTSSGAPNPMRRCVNRRWSNAAVRTRAAKKPKPRTIRNEAAAPATVALPDTAGVWTSRGGSETSIQIKGQNVALLKMLKKYGSGWQTRTVLAQRS